jgi:hypothetical protein
MKNSKPQITTLKLALSLSLGLSLGSIAMPSAAMASSALSDDHMYPYIAPSNCDVSLTLPDNSNNPEFSKLCKYVLVPPRTKGLMRLSTFSPSANIMQCRGVMTHLDSINKLEAALLTVATRIADLAAKGTDDGSLAKEQAKQAVISSALAGLRSAYSGIEAARAQIEFDGAQPESQMNEIRNLNHQVTELKGMVFVRAPISEGYISFVETIVSPEQAKTDPAVLASTIPGFRNGNQTTGPVVMTGAVSGSVTLSLAGACGLIQNYNYKVPLDAKIDEQKVASYMNANYTYSIPIESGVEYKAQVNVDNAIKAISEQYKTSGRFTITDLLRENLQGSSKEICHVAVTRYELAPSDPLKTSNFEDQLSGKVCAEMIKRLVDRMVTKGFVDAASREAGTSAPTQAGGNTASTAYRRECYDNSFAGFSYDSGCADVPYTILTWNDGFSQKQLELTDGTKYEETQNVSIGTVLPRWRTMSFTAQ